LTNHKDNIICEQLVGLAKERDSALAKVYSQHRDSCFSYIFKNSGSTEDAKDVYQEAIIVFYENVLSGKFNGKSAIGTYLYSIVKFKWLNSIKQKGMQVRHKEQIAKDSTVYIDAVKDLVRTESEAQILAVLDTVGLKCKKLLIASFYHQHSIAEIAKIMSFSSEQIVRNQKYKCLKKLRKIVSNSPEIEAILKAYER